MEILALHLDSIAGDSLAFDGGRLSSDGGVLLLREAERRLGLAARLAACMSDRRDPARIDHTVVEMRRLGMFATAGGYEDADNCDSLREGSAFKMAVGRTSETGAPLCSQPTISRLENAPSRIEIARATGNPSAAHTICRRSPRASLSCDVAQGTRRRQIRLDQGRLRVRQFGSVAQTASLILGPSRFSPQVVSPHVSQYEKGIPTS